MGNQANKEFSIKLLYNQIQSNRFSFVVFRHLFIDLKLDGYIMRKSKSYFIIVQSLFLSVYLMLNCSLFRLPCSIRLLPFERQPSKLEAQRNRELKYHNDTNVIYCIGLSSYILSKTDINFICFDYYYCRSSLIWFFFAKLALTFLCMLNTITSHYTNGYSSHER